MCEWVALCSGRGMLWRRNILAVQAFGDETHQSGKIAK